MSRSCFEVVVVDSEAKCDSLLNMIPDLDSALMVVAAVPVPVHVVHYHEMAAEIPIHSYSHFDHDNSLPNTLFPLPLLVVVVVVDTKPIAVADSGNSQDLMRGRGEYDTQR